MTFVVGIAVALANAAGYAAATDSALPESTLAAATAGAPAARLHESAQDVWVKMDVEAKHFVSTKDGVPSRFLPPS